MTVVDSSALVAAVAPEADGRLYAARIQEASGPVVSPLAVFETVLALTRLRSMPVAEATIVLLDYLHRAGISLVPIAADAHVLALAAHERFGKGRGHPAQLNMGDCFSYALAKKSGVPLLYKGDDFSRTDLA